MRYYDQVLEYMGSFPDLKTLFETDRRSFLLSLYFEHKPEDFQVFNIQNVVEAAAAYNGTFTHLALPFDKVFFEWKENDFGVTNRWGIAACRKEPECGLTRRKIPGFNPRI